VGVFYPEFFCTTTRSFMESSSFLVNNSKKFAKTCFFYSGKNTHVYLVKFLKFHGFIFCVHNGGDKLKRLEIYKI
jgi:hypothetical protein